MLTYLIVLFITKMFRSDNCSFSKFIANSEGFIFKRIGIRDVDHGLHSFGHRENGLAGLMHVLCTSHASARDTSY